MHALDEKKAIYSARFSTGGKSYFLDIRETKNKSPYLVICQSSKNRQTDAWERQRLTLFAESIRPFVRQLKTAVEAIDPASLPEDKNLTEATVEMPF